MTRRVLTFAFLAIAAQPALARAQSTKLAHLLPTLFGPDGLRVESAAPLPDGSTHSAHFNNAFQSQFNRFNALLASQLSALPLPSPSSGFTYTMDPALGVFTRSTPSFGPIMAERAETMGKGKFAFGFAVQHFGFDSIDGIDLDALDAVFTHDDPSPGGRSDVVTTLTSVQATVTQEIVFATYGINDSIDVSLAVPFATAEIDASSVATVQRLGTAGNPIVHYYTSPNGAVGSTRDYLEDGRASGLGDLTLRFKGTAASWGSGHGLALGFDLRMPTGNELDLLGSGAWGVRPFAAASWQFGKLSPHLNLGYQWNGDSVLAGDISTGTKGNLPDEFVYAGGFDLGVTRRLTLAADLVGRYLIDASRVSTTTFRGLDDAGTTFPDIRFDQASYNQASLALGMKLNPLGNLLVVFNVLLKVDDHGLRDKAAPLIALDYTF